MEPFTPRAGTPITRAELLRGAARGFSPASLRLRERLSAVALRLALEGLPTPPTPEAIPAARPRGTPRAEMCDTSAKRAPVVHTPASPAPSRLEPIGPEVERYGAQIGLFEPTQ